MPRDKAFKDSVRQEMAVSGVPYSTARRMVSSVKCGSCNNITTNPDGQCHLHQAGALPAVASTLPSQPPPAMYPSGDIEVPVHEFSSSGDAYDASQTDEDIQDGDILFVPSEGVVGILYDVAWPVALTHRSGAFGVFNEGVDPRHTHDGRYTDSVTAAEKLARLHDIPLRGEGPPEPVEPPLPEGPDVMVARFPNEEDAESFRARITSPNWTEADVERIGSRVTWTASPDRGPMYESDLLETVGYYGSTDYEDATLNGRAAYRGY